MPQPGTAMLQVLSRSAVATAFATEMLRDKIPANAAFRTAARDTVVSGVRIPKGTGVIVNLRNVRLVGLLHSPHACTTCMPCTRADRSARVFVTALLWAAWVARLAAADLLHRPGAVAVLVAASM